jgi:integrase/virulence-associated protein VagC
MTFFELAPVLQALILSVSKRKVRDIRDGFLQISQGDYSKVFWRLYDRNIRDEMGKQASAKEATELTHQLNQYILANRQRLAARFSLKNPILIKRPKPPMREHHGQYLPELDHLDRQLLKDPDFGYLALSINSGSVKNAPFYTGQLLYASARFGGLLRSDLLKSMLLCVSTDYPNIFNKIVWLQLTGDLNEEYQWLPDPISSALLPRYFKLRTDNNWCDDPVFKQLNWLTCLRQFLRQSGCSLLSRLSSKQVFELIAARLSLSHTPCHLPVMTGEEPNLMLARDNFLRLLGRSQQVSANNVSGNEPTFDLPGTTGIKELRSQVITKAITDCAAVMKLVKRELLLFNKQYLNQDRHEAVNFPAGLSLSALSAKIKVIAKDDSLILLPITSLLIQWVALRLTTQNKWSGKLKPSTIVTYLNSIFASLSRSFGAYNPLALGADTLDEHYMELIEEAPKLRAQILRAKILRDFHLFLEREYNISPSYVCSTMVMQSSKKMPLMVDANILLPVEYQAACLQLIERTKLSTEPIKQYIQLLLLVLGFRCGLRRREALFLRVVDLQTPGSNPYQVTPLTELLIRPHKARQLKSSASERRIPLGTLLSPTEREWFNHYLKLRSNWPETLYLFSDTALDEPLDADIAFTSIVRLLRVITKDAGFRYHRLRHSFVSWTFWYWQQHKYANAHPLKQFLAHEVMEHLPEARHQYFSQASNSAIRGELHAVSAMAGHSSPSMTLLHYLHSMQWCYSAECWRDYSLNLDTTARLLDIPRRTFFDRLDKLGMPVLLSEALAPWCHELSDEQEGATALINDDSYEQQVSSANDVRKYYQALYLFDLKKLQGYPTNSEGIRTNYVLYEDQTQEELTDLVALTEMWAKERSITPAQFTHSVKLLCSRKSKKNRARRNYKDTATGQTYVSNIALYNLPKWPKDHYAIRTANILISIFQQLSQAEQLQVISVAKYVVTERFVSWNNCQFRQPENLWQFVRNLTPILKRLPNTYFINIDILNRYELDSAKRTPILSLWQRPDDITFTLKINHSVYPDAKGDGYAALTLRTLPDLSPKRDQGDHGFYVAMTALYFYFEPVLASQGDISALQANELEARHATKVENFSSTNQSTNSKINTDSADKSFADADEYLDLNNSYYINSVDDIPEFDMAQIAIEPPQPINYDAHHKSKKRKRKNKEAWDGMPDMFDSDPFESSE